MIDKLEIAVLLAVVDHLLDRHEEDRAIWHETRAIRGGDVNTLVREHLPELETSIFMDYSARNGRRLMLESIAAQLPQRAVLVEDDYATRLSGLGIRDHVPPPGWPYYLSRPGFNTDHGKALIHVNGPGSGFFLVLELGPGGWQVVDGVTTWVY